MEALMVDRLPMAGQMRNCATLYTRIGAFLQTYAGPILSLAIRLWIASVFFKSGLQKLDDWDSTVYLFEYEYMVPILSPALAAAVATAFELMMPVLLTVGLLTRLSALPLLGMALVIQFILGASNPAYDNVEHFYWMFLLGFLIVYGPGRISIDSVVRRMFVTR